MVQFEVVKSMVLIDVVSTAGRRKRIRRNNLFHTSKDITKQPHNDVSPESDFETCNKEFAEFLGLLPCQGFLAARWNQRDDSILNVLDSFCMIGSSGNTISQLLRASEKKEADSKIAMAERLFLKQSLSNLYLIRHALLEGIFVHLYTLLWHSNLCLVSFWETHERTDMPSVSRCIVWSAGLKRSTVQEREDSAAFSARWTDQTSNIGLDSCWFLMRQFRVQATTPISQSTFAPSGKFPGLCNVLEFDSLCCSEQQEPSLLLIYGKSGNGKTQRCERWFVGLDKPRPGCRRPLRGE